MKNSYTSIYPRNEQIAFAFLLFAINSILQLGEIRR